MSDGSVAPKERINIAYKSNTGGLSEEVELPLKLLVLDDFTGKENEEAMEDRETINVGKDNFDDVVKSHNVGMSFTVPNKLEEDDSGDTIDVDLKIKSIKDFDPENVAKQIPELNSLLELRRALLALKGPLGNTPAFRKTIQSILDNEETREKIMKELGVEPE